MFSDCHAERSEDDREAIILAESKHPYLIENGAGVTTTGRCDYRDTSIVNDLRFANVVLRSA